MFERTLAPARGNVQKSVATLQSLKHNLSGAAKKR